MSLDEKVIDKLKKLFKLQQSPNEHEAALAASMAAEIMAKHHLNEATVRLAAGKDAADVVLNEVVDETLRKVESWVSALANGGALGFGCRLYWRTERGWKNGRSCITKVEMRMVGRKGDIEAASYTLAWLMNEIEPMSHREGRGMGVAWKNSFKLGCAVTISSRLEERRNQIMRDVGGANPHAMVLVKKDDAAVAAVMNSLHLRAARPYNISRSDGFHSGKEAGRNINLDGGHSLQAPAKKLTK